MISRNIAAAVLSFSLCAVMPASMAYAQAPLVTEEGTDYGDIAPLVQVDLDPDVALRAVDVYLTLRDTIGTDQLEALSEQSSDESLTTLVPEMKGILEKYGFADEDAWLEVLQSVILAYEALQDDSLEQAKQSLAEIQADTSMSPEQKGRAEAMLRSMIPSDTNMEVIRKMMRDPTVGAKLAQVLEEM
ncbi:hypothetical protein FHS85_004413 [Rhodoligotrophos appendicifer]|uniref:hypothetical protein n=1 Tax=Rhodoligotrophos appendicifer TaxID=987056 RepID=UPI001184CB55|nr:hypothetical protein [Rhodoligotrophos appendicifer]